MKRGRGRPENKSRVTGAELAKLALMSTGAPQIMEQTGMGERAARLLARVSKLTLEEFQETQRNQLQEFLVELADDLRAEKDKLSTYQKGIIYGILHDKLNTQPKSITQNLHIHMKGSDAGSALKAVLGPSVDSVLTAAPARTNKPAAYPEPIEAKTWLAADTTTGDSVSPALKT